nr:hypothetical protein GCM10020093_041390 [Planobispora longispora]
MGFQAAVYVQASVMSLLVINAVMGNGGGYTYFGLVMMPEGLLPLLLALPLGVLIDRMRRRSVLVAVSLLAAFLFLSVSAAEWLGVSTLPHLAAVGAFLAVLRATGENARNSFLPSVAGRDWLVPANAALTIVPGILVPLLIFLPLSEETVKGFSAVVLLGAAVLSAAAALMFRGSLHPRNPGAAEGPVAGDGRRGAFHVASSGAPGDRPVPGAVGAVRRGDRRGRGRVALAVRH